MNAFEVAVLFAIPGFILLMAFELVWSKWKGPDTWHHPADAVSSISSGMTYLVLRTLGFGVLVIGYDWVFGLVAPAEALDHVGAITPVPGGVGPMTIACLLANTYAAACRAASVEPSQLSA